jgi:hypothetical protein
LTSPPFAKTMLGIAEVKLELDQVAFRPIADSGA